MTSMQKLRAAASVVAFGTPTAVAGSVEYENHPATGILCGILLAGAASIVALAAAAGAADERAREQVRAAGTAGEAGLDLDGTPASARTPLYEEPAGGGLEAAFKDGFAYAQQLAADGRLAVPAAPAAQDPEAAAVDLDPARTTHVMASVPTAPPAPGDTPWNRLGPEFMTAQGGQFYQCRHAAGTPLEQQQHADAA